MNVILAKSAGFCFGVKRAVDTVYGELGSGTKICTYGPIIHNEEVVSDLEAQGVAAVGDMDELAARAASARAAGRAPGKVIIRAHGVERGVCEAIEALGYEIIDATCPFVLKIHRLVERYSREGCRIVIVGNEEHPEVRGIKSWSYSEDVAVIGDREDAEHFTA